MTRRTTCFHVQDTMTHCGDNRFANILTSATIRRVLLVCSCHASLVCIILSSWLLACCLFGVCTQAPKHMWVYCVMYYKRWALILSSDSCVPVCNCVSSFLTIPPSAYSNLLPSASTSPVPFHRIQPLGGDSPPKSWVHGVDTYIAACHDRLWLTSCSLLPSLCTTETSHLFRVFHPHNNLVCNQP